VHDFGHRKEREVRKDSLNCLVFDYKVDELSRYKHIFNTFMPNMIYLRFNNEKNSIIK
jgi:hypothetical protein